MLFLRLDEGLAKCPEVFAEIVVADGFFLTKKRTILPIYFFILGSLRSTLTFPEFFQNLPKWLHI